MSRAPSVAENLFGRVRDSIQPGDGVDYSNSESSGTNYASTAGHAGIPVYQEQLASEGLHAQSAPDIGHQHERLLSSNSAQLHSAQTSGGPLPGGFASSVPTVPVGHRLSANNFGLQAQPPSDPAAPDLIEPESRLPIPGALLLGVPAESGASDMIPHVAVGVGPGLKGMRNSKKQFALAVYLAQTTHTRKCLHPFIPFGTAVPPGDTARRLFGFLLNATPDEFFPRAVHLVFGRQITAKKVSDIIRKSLSASKVLPKKSASHFKDFLMAAIGPAGLGKREAVTFLWHRPDALRIFVRGWPVADFADATVPRALFAVLVFGNDPVVPDAKDSILQWGLGRLQVNAGTNGVANKGVDDATLHDIVDPVTNLRVPSILALTLPADEGANTVVRLVSVGCGARPKQYTLGVFVAYSSQSQHYLHSFIESGIVLPGDNKRRLFSTLASTKSSEFFPRACHLIYAKSVDSKDVVGPIIKRLKASLPKRSIEQFKEMMLVAVGRSGLSAGDTVTYLWHKPGGLTVFVRDRRIGDISDEALARVVHTSLVFGDDPLVPLAKESIVRWGLGRVFLKEATELPANQASSKGGDVAGSSLVPRQPVGVEQGGGVVAPHSSAQQEKQRGWSKLRRSIINSKNYRSNVWVSTTMARGLMATVAGSTPDPYCLFELVNVATGKPLRKPLKKRTRANSKTLSPVWDDGEVYWSEIAEDPNSLTLKVFVLDAGTHSSEPLGIVLLSLSKFANGPAVTEWFTLSPGPGDKRNVGTPRGEIRIGLLVESWSAQTIAVHIAAARNLAATVNERMPNQVHVDPFAIVELVDAKSGRPLNKPRRYKTKSAKKTIDPVWNEVVTWPHVEENANFLLIKVTIYDSSTSSICLGGFIVPVAQGLGKSPGPQWYHVEAITNMGSVTPRGNVNLDFSVVEDGQACHLSDHVFSAAGAQKGSKGSGSAVTPSKQSLTRARSTIWVNVSKAKNLVVPDSSLTAEPQVVIELVSSSSLQPFPEPLTWKTSRASDKANPVWNDGEVTWADVPEDASALALTITLFYMVKAANVPLGSVFLPLKPYSNTPPLIDWLPLSNAQGQSSVANGEICVGLEVHSWMAKTIVVWLSEASDLISTNSRNSTDAYAAVELVDRASGKPLKFPRRAKTSTVKSSLNPIWDLEVTWPDVEEHISKLSLKVTVFSVKSIGYDVLGGFIVPLEQELELRKPDAQWHTLELVPNSSFVYAQGKVRLDFSVSDSTRHELLGANILTNVSSKSTEEFEEMKKHPEAVHVGRSTLSSGGNKDSESDEFSSDADGSVDYQIIESIAHRLDDQPTDQHLSRRVSFGANQYHGDEPDENSDTSAEEDSDDEDFSESDDEVVIDWIIVPDHDAFPGQDAYELQVLDGNVDTCKELCTHRGYGGFVLFNGKAYFRRQSAADLRAAAIPMENAALYLMLEQMKPPPVKKTTATPAPTSLKAGAQSGSGLASSTPISTATTTQHFHTHASGNGGLVDERSNPRHAATSPSSLAANDSMPPSQAPLLSAVAYTVLLQEQSLETFNAIARAAFVHTSASILGVKAGQVNIMSVAAGSVAIACRVEKLPGSSAAQSVLSKVADEAILADGLSRAGLGRCTVVNASVLDQPDGAKSQLSSAQIDMESNLTNSSSTFSSNGSSGIDSNTNSSMAAAPRQNMAPGDAATAKKSNAQSSGQYGDVLALLHEVAQPADPKVPAHRKRTINGAALRKLVKEVETAQALGKPLHTNSPSLASAVKKATLPVSPTDFSVHPDDRTQINVEFLDPLFHVIERLDRNKSGVGGKGQQPPQAHSSSALLFSSGVYPVLDFDEKKDASVDDYEQTFSKYKPTSSASTPQSTVKPKRLGYGDPWATSLLVNDNDYPGGEAQELKSVIRADGMTWEQVVASITQTGDTVFAFDRNVCEAIFDVVDVDQSGYLSLEEIVEAGGDPSVIKYAKASHQPILAALLTKGSAINDEEGELKDRKPTRQERLDLERMERAFLQSVDGDGDGRVSRAEWAAFVEFLRLERLTFLKQYMLIFRHVYFGRGLDPTKPFMNPLGLVARGWLPRGWCEDFWYYACNTHPILALFFTDKDNPFTKFEHYVDNLLNVSVTLLGAALLVVYQVCSNGIRFALVLPMHVEPSYLPPYLSLLKQSSLQYYP